jgi:hypothetical protein
MAPKEETLVLYRAAALAYRHTRRELKGMPHDCLWAAAGAVKAIRPDLDDDAAWNSATEAIRWVNMNYPEWFWR